MGRRKTLQEQTIRDNFMFGAVMLEAENSCRLLELILEKEIEKVEVSAEKSIVYNPKYRGVRLDVYTKDSENTRYNIEMQTAVTSTELRSRYYHSQMDMELLLSGVDYENLPDVYVIFICDYDPLGRGKYRYTIDSQCKESPEHDYRDGVHTIMLSTKGENQEDVPEELVKFLKYVGARLEESEKDFGSEYVRQLQDAVRRVKEDRNMEERQLVLDLVIKDHEKAARKEGIKEGIKEGADRVNRLNTQLIQEGKYDDLKRSAEDPDFQQQLFEKYGI